MAKSTADVKPPGKGGPPKPAPTPAAPGPTTASPPGRAVTVPSPEDFEHAKDDALLQLRIGRSAHLFAVGISAALALAGVLVLAFEPSGPSASNSATGFSEFSNTFYLFVVVAAGVAIAGVALYSKWEAYQLWPWELHFSITVGAGAANVLLAAVYVLRVAGVGPFATFALVPWFYPLALAGISVALLGLVLTWSGWGLRQYGAAISACLPVATAAVLLVQPPGGTQGSDALAISLFLSAILYQTAGSFLHLISSGTRVHERELITSGQSRMFRYADEIRVKGEAMQYREAALVKREAAVDTAELSVRRQSDSLKEARAQLDDLEEDYRKRSDAVVEKERTWAGRIAEMDARTSQIDDKLKELELREHEIARLLPQISTREQRLVEREGEQTKRDVELTQRSQELEQRAAAMPEAEARLESRRKELDQKTAELLRREGDVAAREGGAKAPSGAAATISASLAARELQLQQLKVALDEQNVNLGRKNRELAEVLRSAKTAQQQSAAKEAALAQREAALSQREADLQDRLKTADDRRLQYESAAQDYKTRLGDVGRQQVESAQKGADLDRSMKANSDREAAISAREDRIRAQLDELDRREADLRARERSVEVSEAEAQMRVREGLAGSNALTVGLSGALASVAYDRPPGGSDGIRDVTGTETLRAPVGRRVANRLPTGTPRLDDLLLGGIPPRGHIVVLGDAFVGKEIVLYSFLAEGLKRGEPAILITAARPPDEVSQQLALVLPEFAEYEKMGMVTWIDAAGGAGTTSGNRIVTKGSDDRAGILSNLVRASKNAEESGKPAFRVGFLGLSAVLAHADERSSFSFLQNVVGILKPRNALAMYSLEGGALSEPQVETLLSRMDGAIVFRQDRDKTFLSVKGFGEVETREWIECRATNRALIVGSFALERIR
jgi:KaiC/GvpD/RAD55 family RecA-like ATPase